MTTAGQKKGDVEGGDRLRVHRMKLMQALASFRVIVGGPCLGDGTEGTHTRTQRGLVWGVKC
jgi:hypothetical protein